MTRIPKNVHLNLLRLSSKVISDQLFSPTFRLVFKRWFASQLLFFSSSLSFCEKLSLAHVKHVHRILDGRTLLRLYMRTAHFSSKCACTEAN